MAVDALDQSWSHVTPAAAKAAGIKLICGYLSHDPSKNWTADRILAYHRAGIGVLLNWESDSGRPLLGASAGSADAAVAVSLAKQLIAQVGYAPRSKLALVFSCDRDTTPAQYPAIDAYYRATLNRVTPEGFDNGAYGEFDVIEHLHAVGLTQAEWQTLAWSHGLISLEADLYQSSINNTLGGASVDLDQIRHATTLGAWWPPGSPEELAAIAAATPGDDMSAAEVADIKAHVDQQIAQVKADLLAALAPTVQNVKDCRGAAVEIRTAVTNDSLPIRAAQYVTGALALPVGQSGVNVPGVKAAVTASAADVKAHLDTALANHLSGPPGSVDLQPVLAAIAGLPAAIRTELARGLSA